MKYPTTLSSAIRDLVNNEHYRITDVRQSFEFLYGKDAVRRIVTHTMRKNVLDLLANNNAAKW